VPARRVNWLLVGSGDVVRKRVGAALADAAGSRVAALCECDPQRLEEAAQRFGVGATFTDFNRALAEADADAVYLATPVHLHVPQAMAAMKAGKHVLVEKPLGLSADECRKAVALAEETGLVAGCAYYRRFFPCFEAARQMIGEGALGDVVLVRVIYRSWYALPAGGPQPWRIVPGLAGGGVLSDVGSHMLDVVIGLFGMPETVFARVGTLSREWAVDDSAAVLMTLPGGAHCCANFHWNSKAWSHEFEIIGTDASLKWAPCDCGKVVKTVGRDVSELDMPNAPNVHLPVVEDFVRAVLKAGSPRVTLAEAAKTNVLLDAIYESGRSGKEVRP